jgi:uncharacterized protein
MPTQTVLMRCAQCLVLCVFALHAVVAAAQGTDLPRRAYLGMQLDQAPEGVKVAHAVQGGTAVKLGIQAGDVVQEINGTAIKSPNDLAAWVEQQISGTAITVRIVRGSEQKTLQGNLVERAREPSNAQYSVAYGQVASKRGMLRTISTAPTAAGKHPALLFIQGVTLSSIDFPLSDANAYAQIVRAFARGGFVTMRVDKPGVGDSQGGPGSEMDFNDELDGYRQALKALLARPNVDAQRVFIFGHSMGGYWGPVLAGEFKLKGVIVSGTVFRTWAEYELENARRQSKLAGKSEAEVHKDLLRHQAVASGILFERLSPQTLIARNPALKAAVEEAYPAEGAAGRSIDFWRQVHDLNLPEAWSKASGAVLSLYGQADFISDALDHQLLANYVNAQRPDTATYKAVPRSDHAFNNVANQAESFKTWGKPGPQFNPNLFPIMDAWIKPLAGKGLQY